MKIFKQIIDYFKLTPLEKEIANHDIGQENVRRMFYISFAVIPLSLMHIILFWLKLDSSTGIEYRWSFAIIICHSVIVLTFSVVASLLYFFSYRTGKNNKMGLICTNIIMFFVLIIGAVVASVDQMVTSAITPYLLTTLVAGLILLIRPLHALLFFMVSFIFFYFAISIVQLNQDIIISNQVNGFTILGLGLLLSFTLWKAKLTTIIQKRAMVKSAARLVFATKAGGVGIWDYDIASNTLLWDEQMFRLYGITPDVFKSALEAMQTMVHPDDRAKNDDEILKAINGEKEFDTEFRIIWRDGSIHNIRALATLQPDDSEKTLRLLGTNWDITEQKKSEEALLKAKGDAETANKSKSTFLANISHEIRTPLNAIIGFSQLLNREKLLTVPQQEYSDSIYRAGEHLLQLINDILELSKIEAGRSVLMPANFDIHALLKEIQMLFRERVKSKQLQFIIETANDLPRYIVTDEKKLRQILINLIGNAVKFSSEGDISVRCRVDEIKEETKLLIVEIEDSGVGIAENEMGKLFKQFEQTSSGIKNSDGTGLGLALSRELARLMGGDITVASEEGKGSVFTAKVEIREGEFEVHEAAITKRITGIENPQKAYRVLVVDDKEMNRQLLTNFLRLAGFETNEAVDGTDAIAKFEQWEPHLILMDIRMPGMDGYEATRQIRSTEKGKQTPVIAVTAGTFEDEKKEAFALEIQGYIRKPFRENELFETIGNVLGIKYIYEEETTPDALSGYLSNDGIVEKDISKLPDELILQMKDAADRADFILLRILIDWIADKNLSLSKHLASRSDNYDYEYFKKILK